MMEIRGMSTGMLAIVMACVMLQSADLSASAFTSHGRTLNIRYQKVRTRYVQHKNSNSNDENVDDHDDEEDSIKPYRNRSLAWTLRYRKLNPYERARTRVLGFGHRSKDDWDDAVSSGQLGQYVPSYPDEMYAPEWVNWDEWLGLMKSYNDTKNLATNILRLKSLDDYILFVRSDSKRAEGLRIPVRPDIRYKDEWIDEESFFGK